MTQRTSLSRLFESASGTQPNAVPRTKRASPISLRLNDAERKALRKAASGRSINGYIRERLFGDAASNAALKPVSEDHAALARVLGALGQTDVFISLAAISLALEKQQLLVSKETESSIVEACQAITDMRTDLLMALGLRKV
ncbi:hypothetical protein [Phaeobacter inhibens]|uniref:hypothetical protein n=1 Tax=Phaeobacter inhibens TaxID=221822 RepID=UPI0024B7ACB1|nr:hypothetical protein [Phaeobacter inhibens]WHP69404.1 hypothetical protein QMZ01_04240 [Phaeobacter inhibens]